MEPRHILFILFLLLVPDQYFQNCEPKGVSCDYVSSHDHRIRKDNEATEMSSGCYKKKSEHSISEDRDPLPVRVSYQIPDSGKCRKFNPKEEDEEEVCRRGIENFKDAAMKCHAEKVRKQEHNRWKPEDKSTKVDFTKPELKCSAPAKKGSVLCADCEQCELQVKANGEGVLLKCKNCREVPSEEVFFPSGNNKKIISLP